MIIILFYCLLSVCVYVFVYVCIICVCVCVAGEPTGEWTDS